jgi:hypothetical protein
VEFPWIQSFILLASYAVFSLGTWLIWWSRWNLIAPFQCGFFFVAYFVPIMLTDELSPVQSVNPAKFLSTLDLYAAIMAVGACMYAIGLFAGARLPRFKIKARSLFALESAPRSATYVRQRTIWIIAAAVVGLYVSFAIMGYVPMLADDPKQAKYFHDQYRPGYLRAVWLYLPSFSAFIAYVPILMLLMWKRLTIRYLTIFLAGIMAVALTLHRGELGAPLILGIGLVLVASKFKYAIPVFVLFSIVVWCVGALANFFLALYFNISMERIGNEQMTLWTLIAGGAPDIQDNLALLSRFASSPAYTWGRNWLGGLMPNQSIWNPGIWSLSVAMQLSYEEAINFASGGLRVAVPITGFTFCDWPGAISFPFLIGLITGYVAKFAREHTREETPPEVKAVVVLVAAASIGCLDAPTWHTLLPLIVLMPVIYPVAFVFRRRDADITGRSVGPSVLSS